MINRNSTYLAFNMTAGSNSSQIFNSTVKNVTNQAGPNYTLGGFPIVSVTQVSNTVFNVTLKDPVTG
jgi:hypothetical protein